MIRRLINDEPTATWAFGCSAPMETRTNSDEVTVEELKEKVANYQGVMTQDFSVPDKKIPAMINVRITDLQRFIDANSGDATGARIYITECTSDTNEDDFELLFVPCRETVDAENGVYYEDVLDEQPDADSTIFSAMCRRPPGCEFGAVLL